jgi:hypothetical protein
MPSLKQIATECCIWQRHNHYITITFRPNKVKNMLQARKLKGIKCCFVLSIRMPFLGRDVPCMAHVPRVDTSGAEVKQNTISN